MPLRANTAFTPAQRDQLLQLFDAGAIGRENGRSIFDAGMGGANPNVIGILLEKGWSEQRTTRAGGSQRTLYWLTEAGAAKAREVRAG